MLIVVLAFGITYGFWTTTKTQEDVNEINTTCLNVTYHDDNDAIKLEKTYPISDEEGMTLTGYTFTLTNSCKSSVEYQVNLESLEEIAESNRIALSNLKVVLDDNQPKILDTYNQNKNRLISNTYDGRELTKDILSPKDE